MATYQKDFYMLKNMELWYKHRRHVEVPVVLQDKLDTLATEMDVFKATLEPDMKIRFEGGSPYPRSGAI